MMSKEKIYKYNMILYYQSLVIYFIGLLVYFFLKAQFTELKLSILTNDGIFYFFIIIIGYTLLSTLVNLVRRKYVSFFADGFKYKSRFRLNQFSLKEIQDIKIFRDHNYNMNGILRTVKVNFITKKPALIIRPIDYENEIEVLGEFKRLRDELGTIKKGFN